MNTMKLKLLADVANVLFVFVGYLLVMLFTEISFPANIVAVFVGVFISYSGIENITKVEEKLYIWNPKLNKYEYQKRKVKQ